MDVCIETDCCVLRKPIPEDLDFVVSLLTNESLPDFYVIRDQIEASRLNHKF